MKRKGLNIKSRHDKKALKFFYDEKFHVYYTNKDKNFLSFAKRNLKDLMEGKNDLESEVSRVYYTRIEGDKNFRKIPFFIYIPFSNH
jgi:hypothetical protein